MKLSICMMVKNEEKYLEESLKSLRPFFDSFATELIIVDTGSEDSTVDIAKRYTDKVYFHEWNNDFGSMRNKTIGYASGEWILVLDGDEVFEKVDPLIDFLKDPISYKYKTISIGIKNLSKNIKEDSEYSGNILRVFRKSRDFKYEGIIHEQPKFKKPIYFSDAIISHYGYDSSDSGLMEYKFKRNVDLLKEVLEKEPENTYILFQLSQSYGMYNKYEKALELILRAYNLVKHNKKDQEKYLYLYNHLIRMYFENKKYEELEEICKKALEIADDFIDFYYYLAIAQKILNKNQQSLTNFKKYLSLLKDDTKGARDLILVKSTLDFYENAYINMAIIYKELKEYDRALEYIHKVTKKDLQIQRNNLLINLYIKLEEYDKLKLEYKNMLGKISDSNIIKSFWVSLEKYKKEINSQDNIDLIRLFSTDEDEYSFLNKIRLKIIDKSFNTDNHLLEQIKQLDFNNLPVFFADIIYYLLNIKTTNMGELFQGVRLYHIEDYIEYMSREYDFELKDIGLDYLDKFKLNTARSFNEIRFQKELKKSLLINDLVDYNDYKQLFDSYIADGIEYMRNIYRGDVLENENIYDVKNNEEIFLIYMYKAIKVKKINVIYYIQYLKKILKVYPSMKKGIEILLRELQQNNDTIQDDNLQGGTESESEKNISKTTYELIETRSNSPTLKVNLKDTTIFLHSKYNPQREALNIANENYFENVENYIIFGLGFGYHVEELMKLAPDSNFYIVETNKDIFKMAMDNIDLTNIINNKSVRLFVSDDIKEIGQILKDLIKLDNIKIVIHNASLNIMPEELIEIKHLLEEFKLKESSTEEFSDMLEENFKINIKNFDKNADTLFNKFNNIPLYIVSAGPSLDKNIKELGKIKDKGIILCVGRAAKALYKENIRPDFIIITDAKPTIYRGQLRGLDIDVPLIGLSTCDKNAFINYKGQKLIALQNGYNLAEEYAKEHGNELVDTGGSVATTALDIAIRMGSNPIIFVGQDLAFTDQKTHTSFTSSKHVNHSQNLREVEDISGNVTYTSKNLSIYLRWIQNRIAKEKNITFIDATEGGARIKGTQVLTLKKIVERY